MEETNPCRRISIGGNGWAAAICGPATQHPRPLSLNLFLFFLFCAVPPTIAPFSFNKDLSEGVRAQVTCMVEKGDPPFTIAWSKDGEAIAGPSPAAGFGNTGITGPRHTQTPAGLRVTNIDAHSSTIVIERVSAAHSGNYTCMARNSVAEVLWTAELIVRGKVESINQDNHQKKKKKITTLARIDEIALQCFFNATHRLTFYVPCCCFFLFFSLCLFCTTGNAPSYYYSVIILPNILFFILPCIGWSISTMKRSMAFLRMKKNSRLQSNACNRMYNLVVHFQRS